MADVSRARGSAGLVVVSTFSGCGGSSLGFAMAGYRTVYALEFIEAARAVYALNNPGVPIDGRDVRAVRAEDLLAIAGVERGEVDLLEGSPPCASFSTAGNREGDWGKVKSYSDTKQRTDDLFFEFSRLLDGIRPRAFVAENVYGLVKGPAFGYFEMIIKRFREAGYRVKAKLLDAQWLGVPQGRQRLIMVGVREDLGIEPPFPTPLPRRYSMLDAFVGIEPTPAELAPARAAMTGTAIGREWDKMRVGSSSERYFQLVRPNPELPVPCVTATGGQRGAAGVVHPTERRKFTIRELKRICAFPDDFELVGTYEQQWERLGRSVPPRMMFHVARQIRDRVFGPLGLVRSGFVEAG